MKETGISHGEQLATRIWEDLTVPITLDQMRLSAALAEIPSDEEKERTTLQEGSKAKPLAAIRN